MVEIMMDAVVLALGQTQSAPKDVQNRAVQAVTRFPRFRLKRLLQIIIDAAKRDSFHLASPHDAVA